MNQFEHQEQCLVIDWADSLVHFYPELDSLYAIPNGGDRPKKQNPNKLGIKKV